MILNNKTTNINYYMEMYEHSYMEDYLYGMVKDRGVTVSTVSFKMSEFQLIAEICKGQNRRLLMRTYKNSSIKDLCKLRIRNKKPIKMINYT